MTAVTPVAPVAPGGRAGVARVAGALAAGYLLGSVPVAGLVARRRHVDLRTVGDRNPGWWNAKDALGPRRAAPVLVGDVAKGVAAGLVGRAAAAGRWPVGYAVVGAAMAGHAWPALAGFRGGRSVLTWVGGTVALAPRPAAVALVTCAATALARRDFAGGARAGVASLPLWQLVLEGPRRTAASGALMSLIGLRFLTAGRSAPARSAAGGSPRR